MAKHDLVASLNKLNSFKITSAPKASAEPDSRAVRATLTGATAWQKTCLHQEKRAWFFAKAFLASTSSLIPAKSSLNVLLVDSSDQDSIASHGLSVKSRASVQWDDCSETSSHSPVLSQVVLPLLATVFEVKLKRHLDNAKKSLATERHNSFQNLLIETSRLTLSPAQMTCQKEDIRVDDVSESRKVVDEAGSLTTNGRIFTEDECRSQNLISCPTHALSHFSPQGGTLAKLLDVSEEAEMKLFW